MRTKKFKVVIISFLIALLFTTPYLIRNYNTFSVITITKSSGYNLWRGNHFNAKVEGNQYHDNKMIEKIKNIKPSKNYDLDLDEMYMKEAIKNIKENPNYYLKLYFKKVFSFIFIDLNSTYENYYSYLNILPKIIISITILCLNINPYFSKIGICLYNIFQYPNR